MRGRMLVGAGGTRLLRAVFCCKSCLAGKMKELCTKTSAPVVVSSTGVGGVTITRPTFGESRVRLKYNPDLDSLTRTRAIS